jgi:hypothetical protein
MVPVTMWRYEAVNRFRWTLAMAPAPPEAVAEVPPTTVNWQGLAVDCRRHRVDVV